MLKLKLPKCVDCGGASPHVVSIPFRDSRGVEHIRHEWVCTTCEYKRAFPDAPMIPAHPAYRRPKKLQSETLFDAPPKEDAA